MDHSIHPKPMLSGPPVKKKAQRRRGAKLVKLPYESRLFLNHVRFRALRRKKKLRSMLRWDGQGSRESPGWKTRGLGQVSLK